MISLHEPRFNREDENLVLEALRSTWVSTGGPFVDQFERDFASYVGTKHAISVSNGTIALQLALEVLKRQRGHHGPYDVLVPTLSFIATSNAVSHAGGTPILVDCALNSMNIDPAAIDALIPKHYSCSSSGFWHNNRTGNILLCIMPAHIMGWSCDMAALEKISNAYNIPVIDDAAEALGSRYLDGRHLGKTSIAAGFSFNGNKIITTGGGGMIVTDDDQFARLAKHLSTTAKTDNLRYVHDQVGYNFRMVNLLAALGVSQLAQMPKILESKRFIAASYKHQLSAIGVRILEEPFNKPNHWIVNAMFDSERHREQALTGLMARKIQARPLWTPAHKLNFMTSENSLEQAFPNSENVWKKTLSLPSSAHLTEDEILTVVRTIKEYLS